jgi:hypothetical protein
MAESERGWRIVYHSASESMSHVMPTKEAADSLAAGSAAPAGRAPG